MTGWCLHFAWLCLTATFFAPTVTGDSCRPSFGYETFPNIREDTKVGNVLLVVDTGNDSVLSVETNLSATPFDFDNQTRALSLRKTLDSEYGEQTFRIIFKCKLQGLPDSASTNIGVTISVTDVNDNPPVFTQCCYNLSLGEMTRVNTTFSTSMRATDADKDYSNNAIYYSILPGPYSNYFSLLDRMKINELRLVRQLDYESVPSMTITILAVNDMSDIRLNSTADVTITVVDEDDQNPVFNQTIYQGYVQENASRGTIVTITPPMFAYDADKTINSPVTYSFHGMFSLGAVVESKDGQDLLNGFQINRTTAEVRVDSPISATTVSIVVQATQVDNPTRYGVAMLVVTVQGASLSAPQFLQTPFSPRCPKTVRSALRC
ncbi:protocadherin Fat 1-like isoform X1 [Pomacea canaliculata]|uniref:protocadherin Fat 1-like isoform X1 n=1 Tax=Pomacea canaliculata TaxID=400727 RepID=UPI000D73E877|nr:protocadherin Fat 1-like isoform X1 [Pomacea canaliculata]